MAVNFFVFQPIAVKFKIYVNFGKHKKNMFEKI